MTDAAISKEDFRAIMGSFASSVTVVTTVNNAGTRFGITVSAFSSLSLEPPLCLVCVDHRAGSLHALKESGKFAVNILSAEQDAVSNRFASRSDDKFAETKWEPGPVTGMPVFPDALGWMECTVHDVAAGGDHQIFIGRLQSVKVNEGKPLLYWRGAYGDITSRPKSW